MSLLAELNTPIFAAEGVPEDTDPARWRVKISGLVKSELTLSLADLQALGSARVNCRLTSVSGWSVRVDWEGLPWRDFIQSLPPLPAATHVMFKSPGGYRTAAPLLALDHPRVLLAWAVAGQPLDPNYGGPLRVVIPNLWGYKSCKWVAQIAYQDRAEPGYWETRGYTQDALIEPGFTLDVNTQTRRPINGGEVTEF